MERKAQAGKRARTTEPRRSRGQSRGPKRWLVEDLLSAYEARPPVRASAAAASASPKSAFEARGIGGATAWHDAFQEYRRRKSDTRVAAAAAPPSMPGFAGAPAVAGAANWLSLGPLVVMDGQTGGGERQPVAGRVAGLAVGPGGNTLYAASANGGVFLSNNGAGIWKATEEIDIDPNSPASASLICGAIAIDPTNPNRVFVGTGEGATYGYFLQRITGALPAYRGIGVLKGENGGAKWEVEPSSPDLSGQAFFALAIDPAKPESVVGATTAGLYRRTKQAGGQPEWVRVEEGVFSSVVAASAGGVTRFFCARWPQEGEAATAGVLWSADGATWKPAGSGFPAANVGRIALGVRGRNPDLVYALAARPDGWLLGLYRLDGVDASWKPVAAVPAILPSQQGNYDLAIAVDPEKEDILYLGGSYEESGGASVWRCEIQKNGAAYRVASSTLIGQHAHSDVHVLVHSPDNPNELWCGCDGGVFLNRDPRGSGTGLQDNGTAYKNGSTWNHVQDGDGGYCVVNWADPNQVLVFAIGAIYRSTTGGKTHDSWSPPKTWGWKTMTQPIVGLPLDPDPAHAADAKLVAVGVGSRIRISEDFGATWPNALA